MSSPRVTHGRAAVQDPTLQLPPVHVTNAWSDENPQPSKGAGWFGMGPPLQVRQNYRVRPFEDGAGICSPGRWTPKKRLLPDVGNVAEDLIAAMGLDMENWETTTFRIISGKQQQNPFTPEQIAPLNSSRRFKAGDAPCYLIVAYNWDMGISENAKAELREEGLLPPAPGDAAEDQATSEETQEDEEVTPLRNRWNTDY